MSDNSDLPNHRIVFESDFIIVYHSFVDDWIYSKWIGDHTLDNIKFGCEQILLGLLSERCQKLLNDEREINTFHWPAKDWAIEEFLPRLADSGLKDFAWVYSPKEFRRLAVDKIISHFPPGIMVIAFENIEGAKEWLRSM